MKLILALVLSLIFTPKSQSSFQSISEQECTDQNLLYSRQQGLCGTQLEFQECFDYLQTLDIADVNNLDTDIQENTASHSNDLKFTVESKYHDRNVNYKDIQDDCEFAEKLKVTFDSIPRDNVQQQYCMREKPEFKFNNKQLCGGTGSQQNIIWKYEWVWDDLQPHKYEFRFGMDFGLGMAVELDGIWEIVTKNNIWWQEQWSNISVQRFSRVLTPGKHVMRVFGQEGGDDGNNQIQFKVNTTSSYTWQEMTFNNLASTFSDYYEPNGSVKSVNGVQLSVKPLQHTFKIIYQNGFELRTSCLDQVITVGDPNDATKQIKIPQGSTYLNQWMLNDDNNNGHYDDSQFTLRHADLRDIYGCAFNNGSTMFTWQCGVTVKLNFGNDMLYKFQYTYTTTLDKKTDEITQNTSLINNDLDFDPSACCKNELGIVTALMLCEDNQCNTPYDPQNDQIIRMSDLYIKHYITTQEFDHLELEKFQANYGVFQLLLSVESSGPGFIIYKTNISVTGVQEQLQIISTLKINRRRTLKEVESQLTKATEIFNIVDPEDLKKEQQEQEEQQLMVKNAKLEQSNEDDQKLPMFIGISAASGLFLGIIVGAGLLYACFLRKQMAVRKMLFKQSSNKSIDFESQLQQSQAANSTARKMNDSAPNNNN